jgi:hypothetical protein
MAKQTKGNGTQAAKVAPQTQSPVEYDWSKVGVSGMENVTTDDLGIPFLSICQKGSPEFDATDPDHAAKKIEGITPGDIFNTMSRQIVYKFRGPPALFIPCYYDRVHIEWKPRASGGGMVHIHRDERILQNARRDEETSRDVLPNGNIIVTTSQFYGYHVDGHEMNKAIIALTSTQLKKSRSWLNIANAIKFTKPDGSKYTPPLFSHQYALGTGPENNAKGSWFGWTVECAGPVQSIRQIDGAVELATSIKSGQARLALPAPIDAESGAVM